MTNNKMTFFNRIAQVLIFISTFFIGGITVSSCSSCEENASRFYDINVDLDGDGDEGDRGGTYNPNFKGKCNHVDKHIPWNECDNCGLHKVYW